ncbi:MAG: leucine-rich repeat domain-containing protein [Bacteroides sp.]|nr:leucine-rich repeat domain-containing protein [Bacteroides sp.]
MKRIYLFLLLACFSIFANAYDFCIDGIYYNIVSIQNRTVEVTDANQRHPTDMSGQPSSYNISTISIPSTVTYKGKAFRVIGIGIEAFYHSSVSEVKLPEGLEYIGPGAFSNIGFFKVNLPSTLKIIKFEAFKNDRVVTFSIPKSVRTIEAKALPQAMRISIEDGSTPIEFYAFSNLNANEIYIGRTFIIDGPPFEYVEFADFVTITIGRFVKNITHLFYCDLPKKTKIIVKNPIPPQLAPLQSKEIMMNCIVEVPNSSLQVYQNAQGWRDFLNLEGK